MELLRIQHTDFTLTIECDTFQSVIGKARGNKIESLHSYYAWNMTDDVRSAVLITEEGTETVLANGDTEAPPIFFDNADYPVWVEFEQGTEAARFGSMLRSENEHFSFRQKTRTLTGFLNFGNEIGRAELPIMYRRYEHEHEFIFCFDVLSTKLDYHSHWAEIIRDIEQEYRMLSIDYMRRTFQSFSQSDDSQEPADIIWWNVFREKQQEFTKAIHTIIDRPKHHLRSKVEFCRANSLKRISRETENALAEHRKEAGHLYRTEQPVNNNDTPENQFLKYALKEITGKFELLNRRIAEHSNLDHDKAEEIYHMADELKRLQRHPFFRNVGPYQGKQLNSQIIQQAPGYNTVFRTWRLLKKSFSLNEGLYRLQTKDIATLYEIWCFIEVSHIVRAQMGEDDTKVDHQNRMEMSDMFTYQLSKGEHSRIVFRKGDVELAELMYNPKETMHSSTNAGIADLVSRTVPQKPDIVLRLTKDDLNKGMKMTYLFDAKYRIDGHQNGVDTPPDDAINQMHRYRDAIYYKEYGTNVLKKEVIGGYILFPGNGSSPEDIRKTRFYEAVDEVNIGAFPLRPGDKVNRELLDEFVHKLIDEPSAQTVAEVIPQKGAIVSVGERLLVGYATTSKRTGSFEDGTAELYYTGAKFPSTISLDNLHYFAPYLDGKGVRDVYRIKSIRTISGIKSEHGAETDLRLAFELEKTSRKLCEDWTETDLPIKHSFDDTTFAKISEKLKTK